MIFSLHPELIVEYTAEYVWEVTRVHIFFRLGFRHLFFYWLTRLFFIIILVILNSTFFYAPKKSMSHFFTDKIMLQPFFYLKKCLTCFNSLLLLIFMTSVWLENLKELSEHLISFRILLSPMIPSLLLDFIKHSEDLEHQRSRVVWSIK